MKNLESLLIESRPSPIQSAYHQQILEQEIQKRIQDPGIEVLSLRTYFIILLGCLLILFFVIIFHQRGDYKDEAIYSYGTEEHLKY